MSDKSLLQYYLQELALLEDDCATFAATYPAVAANLGLGSEGASDSHVRQLIESVAFIAARLKRHMDGASREVAYSLLQSLAPHLVSPLPAMSVARFTPRNAQLEPTASKPPGVVHLQATSSFSKDVQFTGVDPAFALWPLQLQCRWGGSSHATALPAKLATTISEGDFVLTMEHPTKPVAAGDPGELTFFVSGPLSRAMAAIEALACGTHQIRLMSSDGAWSIQVPRENLQIQGFDSADRLLSTSLGASQASSQALELLNFPRRFCFFRVRGIACAQPARVFHLVLSVEQQWRAALDAVRQNIHLNCIPVLNLFKRGPVALNLRGRRDEYLIPRIDANRGSWDVFSVNKVRLTARQAERELPEFHAGITSEGALAGEPYWQGIRRDRASTSTGHASLGMRFVNLDAAKTSDDEEFDTAFVDLTMTQCNEPASLTAGQSMAVLGWECGYQATLEFVPTAYVEPVLPAGARVPGLLKALQWRTADDKSLTAMVHQYLAAHHRSGQAHAAGLLQVLDHIERNVVAMPWPGKGAGPLVMGCRYALGLRATDQPIPTRYLFPRLVHSILSQTHSLPIPMEVCVRNAQKELDLVR